MSIELKIPKVGESITEVQIAEWLKSEGNQINRDDPLAVIDSEKTTFELPAPQGGTLSKILHKAGETVAVGAVVAEMEPGTVVSPKKEPQSGTKPKQKPKSSDEAVDIKQSPAPPAKDEPAPRSSDAGTPPAEPVETYESSDLVHQRRESTAAPVSKKADQQKESPATQKPAAPQNKAGEKAEAAAEKQPSAQEEEAPKPVETPKAPPARPARAESATKPAEAAESEEAEEEVVPMTMMRRTIARRLVEAQQTMAMLTTFNEVDMNAVQLFRRENQEAFQSRHGVKLGLMSYFIKAAIDALKQFPQLNAEVRGNDIVYHNYFDIGVAVAIEQGLVVPVLRRAERLSFAEIEKAVAEFARRAREDELKPADLEGGTFTITNGGVFGSLLSTPIVNPPQTGILGLHKIEERPVAREGMVVIRPMMYVALTYDHRIVDGRDAVLFLQRIKEAVEDPVRMLVEV